MKRHFVLKRLLQAQTAHALFEGQSPEAQQTPLNSVPTSLINFAPMEPTLYFKSICDDAASIRPHRGDHSRALAVCRICQRPSAVWCKGTELSHYRNQR